MTEPFLAFCEHIQCQLSPAFIQPSDERPLSTLLEIVDREEPSRPRMSVTVRIFNWIWHYSSRLTRTDAALLHALSATGHSTLKNTYRLPIFHISPDSYRGRTLKSPERVIACNNTSRNVGVTRGGNLVAVIRNDVVIMSVDGHVLQMFPIENDFWGHYTFVDPQGYIWIRRLSSYLFCCYTEAGRLGSRVLNTGTSNSIIAFFPDGRMVTARFVVHLERYVLHVSTPEGTSIRIINLRELPSEIKDVKVCPCTEKIYVLGKKGLYVVSSEGEFLGLVRLKLNVPISMTLSDDRYVLVSEFYGRCVSVWSVLGEFVCRWPLQSNPWSVAILPNKQIAVVLKNGNINIY